MQTYTYNGHFLYLFFIWQYFKCLEIVSFLYWFSDSNNKKKLFYVNHIKKKILILGTFLADTSYWEKNPWSGLPSSGITRGGRRSWSRWGEEEGRPVGSGSSNRWNLYWWDRRSLSLNITRVKYGKILSLNCSKILLKVASLSNRTFPLFSRYWFPHDLTYVQLSLLSHARLHCRYSLGKKDRYFQQI